ncbi:Septin [Rhizoclosmatium globosum]|uniref:Septin n=1 Tax=Rhizoclosmatium globosum TaxID=329046 RepID=A0A1Y2CL76_9FUNG|nr:Septin [Rhizoclosmatium globosum]|eukprot:ORY47736.1 Septin [Rhizoclosmatium globosum]
MATPAKASPTAPATTAPATAAAPKVAPAATTATAAKPAAAPAKASNVSVGIANLPNQRHKIVSRKGTNFTVMVVGESGLGKSTYINTLFTTLMREYKRPEHRFAKQLDRTVNIDVVRADIEEKGFNVRLTVIDTPGFGDYANNQDCWVPIVQFLDEQHQHILNHETAINRKVDDLRVHVCLYFIQPTGHTLKPLDIEVMKQLCTRVNLIPVIAKADTITPADMLAFKDRVIFSPPAHSEDEESTRRNQSILSAMPFSIISSENDVSVYGQLVRGRQYLWGVAEVENEAHCDFKKLRNLLIRTHMHDLITSTHDSHYESYRVKKLSAEGRSDDDPLVSARRAFEAKMKEEEEALRKRFTEQVRVEENRFRQWEQKLISERDRLNEDLDKQHQLVKQLEEELEEIIAARKR